MEIPREKLIWMYEKMIEIRQFEEKIYYLFLQGEMPGTIHLYPGQEAVAAGVCANLNKDDVITSTHRPHGHALAKGVSLKSAMAELFAKTTGCCKAKGGSMHMGDMEAGAIPAIAIVGGGIPVATGAALAFKMKKTKQVAACFFGDGAANEGAFHEALNMGAIWNLPIVYVCENNLYGASTHVTKVMKIKDIATRASAYGMEGIITDGNDVIAVYETVHEAVEKARNGGGPTLVECKTYRRGGHSRTDGNIYRDKEEEKEWMAKDPIPRMKEYLISNRILTEAKSKEIEQKKEKEIDDAVEFAKSSPSPRQEDALEDVFA